MKPVKKIKLPEAMVSQATRNIFVELGTDGKAPAVMFVGGCVRNALLDKAVSDIDLATVWTPQEVTVRLKKAGIKVIPTGIAHGTVTAVLNGESFQITTLRRDIDTDGRHALIAYTNDWVEDARRRDFTVNTLLADGWGNIYDPLGRGIGDLAKGKIVFVGDAETRIREDHLRILRFFRFHAWYGKGRPDAGGLAACVKLAKGVKTLSKERVTQEIFKILLSPQPRILNIMFRNNILKSLFHPKFDAELLDSDFGLELGLLIIANFSKSGAARIEKILRLTNKQSKQLDEAVLYFKKFKVVSEHNLKVLLYRAGHDVTRLALLSRLIMAKASKAEIKKWMNTFAQMERPVLPLRGQDLLDLGMMPGPDIKHALEKFERAWIKNNFEA